MKLTKDSFDLDNIVLYEKNDSDTPTGYQVLGVYFPENATHEDIKNTVKQILEDTKFRELVVEEVATHDHYGGSHRCDFCKRAKQLLGQCKK